MSKDFIKNTGLLLEKRPSAKDWRFLGYTGIDDKILQPDGQWDRYLPEYESQKKNTFDTYACVTYATLNCVETIILRKFGREENYSDRFLATISGTVCNRGNYMSRVANALIEYGCCFESAWPFTADLMSCSSYYTAIPQMVKDLALVFKKFFDFRWEWVWGGTDTIKEALKYSPLAAVVNNNSHVIMLYGYEEGKFWKAYDHYENKFKVFEWDYDFGSIMKFSLNKKTMPPFELYNDTLVQEVEKSGTFGLYLDGKIIIDEPALLNLTWIMRNNGRIEGRTRALTKQEWDSFDKINLKKEPI